MTEASARRAAEMAARRAYGRLVALLAARTRDIAAAEDCLADAFEAALEHWPRQGVPDKPEAWLMSVARNARRNQLRHRMVAEAFARDPAFALDEKDDEVDALPDDRLKLLFVCAHPAIAADVRTPLMLQAVLGLDAAQIAAAFLVPPATMSQRLVRAKAKIRDAGLRFELPAREDLPPRMDDVLDAVYAAYGRSWDALPGADGSAPPLALEALFLGRLLVELLPDEPEPKGLLALMLYCESRRAARRDAAGRFVPLAAQDPSRWSREQIVEAENLLTRASRAGRIGRFQCEAAIQSVHAQRPLTGRANHDALALLYQLLTSHYPSVGGSVSHAAALLDAGQAQAAREVLDKLPPRECESYQPYWAVRAQVLTALEAPEAARQARERAIALARDPAIADYLRSLE